MKISYKWLQSYFEEKLPAPEELAERITFAFAEVESVEKKGEDTVLDIKVLPDRACYALSHRGVAYEISAITGLLKKEMHWPQPTISKVRPLEVSVEAPELCSRYMARVVENVSAKKLPWVKEHLESIGQRSINPVVDGANIVMFDMGQPLHTFDADKVRGGIVVRRAQRGETITTLDNREVALDEETLVIADEDTPLAIAGIKGGKKAEVTASTKNLILESANFNASYIRKTSERLGVKSEASKRYENKLSPEWAAVGLNDFTAYLYEMDTRLSAGDITDIYPTPQRQHTDKLENVGMSVGEGRKISVAPEYISKKLGLKVSGADIEKVLNRLEIGIEKKGSEWTLTPPHFRRDLVVPEDIAEEVGRLVGYDKIPAVLPQRIEKDAVVPKSFYYEWKIREVFTEAGFSEIMTSSFAEKGSVAIEKSLAEDKKYARPNLRGSFAKALAMNAKNTSLFGEKAVRVFEMGNVFQNAGEHSALAIGVAGPRKKAADILESSVATLSDTLGAPLEGEIKKEGVVEFDLDVVFAKLPEPKKWDIKIPPSKAEKFQPFSFYPFIVRDIALFVPPETKPDAVAVLLKRHAGSMVVRGPELFDEFSKDGRKSLAFRFVFQSQDRTLTDAEANAAMERVYAAVASRGWKVR
ncbi:MAG: Phenylalanine-tRNA ligase beta subunit [Parcubacteria group bacterium Greene0416_79]|nr:MAG: Phenylalanine-tRNA ligase beta subunit [Parcubacteria group bacterium Greene0416_79]